MSLIHVLAIGLGLCSSILLCLTVLQQKQLRRQARKIEEQKNLQTHWQSRWQERELQVEKTLHDRGRRIESLEAERIQLHSENSRLRTQLEQALQQWQQKQQGFFQQFFEQQNQLQNGYFQNRLEPLQKQIHYLQQGLQKQYQENLKNSTQMEQYLKRLHEDSQRLNAEALQFSKALQGNQQQGAWGEMVLSRTLEESGLRQGIEYHLQQSFQAPGGRLFRPDAVIHFPGDRYLIIDAKVSLQSYQEYLSAREEEPKRQLIKKHCESMLRHIRELGKKNYSQLLGMQRGPDFVLLFNPIEGALAEALRFEPKLFDEAFRNRVILVSPSLLFAVLRIAEQLWRYERQSDNEAEIYRQAGKIYDQLALFCKDIEDCGKKLKSLNKMFDQAAKRLYQGSRSLVSQVENLKSLGAETSRTLPAEMIS